MPERIQLQRKRGWRLPVNAVSVSRPTRWGNMFKVGGLVDEPGPWRGPAVPREDGLPGTYKSRDIAGQEYEYVVRKVRDRADAVALFRAYIRFHDDRWAPEVIRRKLGGKSLACWCPLPAEEAPDICHAAVLLAIASPETGTCRHCGGELIRCNPPHDLPVCKGWKHAAWLADEAELTGADRLVIVFAALLHDAGKVTHTQFAGGRVTSHGHAAAGTAPASVFLRCIGCPEGVTARILPLIREHMCCYDQPTKPAVRRLARRLVPATLAELVLVAGGDRKGRGDPDAPNPAEAWLEMARGLKVQERPAKGLLTGDHLIAAGMKPGPAFRPLLAEALAAQDAGEFSDEDGAVRWLAAITGKPA